MVLRLGLVGYGHWGRNIERTLNQFPNVKLSLIGRGEKAPGDIDGVLIATSSASHAGLALPFIEAGIPTFIEKPMATTVADAQRIREVAHQKGTPVFVGHIHLHNPAFLALCDILPKIGPIRFVLCQAMNGRPRTDSSVLWDWLPHDLSMAQRLFGGNPVGVSAWKLTPSAIPEAATVRFEYPNGNLVSTSSWVSQVNRQSMTICAEKGTVSFNDKAERKLVVYDEAGVASYPSYSSELPLTHELAAFVGMVEAGRPDPSELDLGLSIVRAIAAAEESIGKGTASVPV